MNYIGSKKTLLEFLEDSINAVVKDDCLVFCDLFAGTGAVGSHFKKKGYRIIANDIQYYSFVLNRHYIENHKKLFFKKLEKAIPDLKNTDITEKKDIVCNYLSNLKEIKGFIYQNYCTGGTKNKEIQRLYFSDKNGMRCDAVRQKIEEWKKAELINADEYYFLLASLLESIDKHANTASVYGAFLKKLKNSAVSDFELKPAELIENKQSHEVYNKDANELVKSEGVQCDILYLDPPYNQRQYATNYHILETIARYDKPEIHGKTGLRNYQKEKSSYCSRVEVKNAFRDLILNAKTRYIFLSYNNEGLMTPGDIKEIMGLRGEYGFFTKEYGRFSADKGREYKAKSTTEYLHYVVCRR